MSSDFEPVQLSPEELARRWVRRVEVPTSLTFVQGLVLSMAGKIREDETLSEAQKLEAARALPRNRAEARRYVKGNGPWGLARKR